MNSGKEIRELKEKIVTMQNQGGTRDCKECNRLQSQLGKEYKNKEVYW